MLCYARLKPLKYVCTLGAFSLVYIIGLRFWALIAINRISFNRKVCKDT